MLNIEKYKDELIKRYRDGLCPLSKVVENVISKEDPEAYRRLCANRILTTDVIIEWLASEYVEPLLNKQELEYLAGVISPFKDRVNYIYKKELTKHGSITIVYDETIYLQLPTFKAGEMYRGMEANRKYTLEELGLCKLS